jgi:hypothetical protein
LCSEDSIAEPFAVINADDFYGRDAFEKAYSFLTEGCTERNYAIIGYQLKQTLSSHGTVNRGVCSVNDSGNLTGVVERLNIAEQDGQILVEDGMEPKLLTEETIVSMNFWCFHPSVFKYSSVLFQEFLKERGTEEKSEFFIPLVADRFMNETDGKVEVIPTSAIWFGVTYKEDAPAVKEAIGTLLNTGEYPAGLWK